MMKKLGEQWVEDIDDEKHMFKCVVGNKCEDCIYRKIGTACYACDIPTNMTVKDLGILNEDGLLPCPFCGEHPEIEKYEADIGYNDVEMYHVFCSANICKTATQVIEYSLQQAIDAWNRRS